MFTKSLKLILLVLLALSFVACIMPAPSTPQLPPPQVVVVNPGAGNAAPSNAGGSGWQKY